MTSLAQTRPAEFWLKDSRWDNIFITGGALLVPVPILAFYILRSCGLPIGVCEDLATALVMVTVGGPHVFATYTRTFFDPTFPRRERLLFFGALAVIGVVVSAAIASAFFQARAGGAPLMQYVLTFFFFWAAIHVIHQCSYCAACYEDGARRGAVSLRRRLWNSVDYLVMLGALYPVAFFRMSLANPAGTGADPDALATKVLLGLGATPEFADQFLFRIGRVAPILPDFMVSDAFWVLVSVAFLAVAAAFCVKSVREARAGTLNRPRFQLVAITGVVGFLVPAVPNLDAGFQGINAWHSFQYLGLLWLMNRNSYDRGEIPTRFVREMSKPGRHGRFYLIALVATLGLLLLIVCAGLVIEHATDGAFVLLGHEQTPLDPESGRPLYRPGSLLLAYYMVGFSLLLVHYLHDGFFFFRKRYVLGDGARRG